MDVLIENKNTPFKRKIAKIGIPISVLVVVIIAIYLGSQTSITDKSIEKDALVLGKVERGNVNLSIKGYGFLRSNKQVVLTATRSATVKEIFHRPGAKLEKNTKILQLENNELMEEVENSKFALAQEQGELRRLELTRDRELLHERSILSDLNIELNVIQVNLDAQKSLFQQGIGSQLQYKTTKLHKEQIEQRVAAQSRRIEQHQQIHSEILQIQKDQISRAESRHRLLLEQVKNLSVIAGVNGVLQRLPLSLGQTVLPGQELALVSSTKDLVAFVRVPQSRADFLVTGQQAKIQLREQFSEGIVTRIAPEVQDGSVQIEVAFSSSVPSFARPELNISAEIFTEKLEDTLYVKRPTNVSSGTVKKLFVLSENQKTANLTAVEFGKGTEKIIQILNGVNEGNYVILNDSNEFQSSTTLSIL